MVLALCLRLVPFAGLRSGRVSNLPGVGSATVDGSARVICGFTAEVDDYAQRVTAGEFSPTSTVISFHQYCFLTTPSGGRRGRCLVDPQFAFLPMTPSPELWYCPQGGRSSAR